MPRLNARCLLVLLIIPIIALQAGCSAPLEASRQEPTDTLIIYQPPHLAHWLPAAVRIFEAEFPEVEVEVRTFGDEWWGHSAQEEFNQVLRNDLMVGRGPDVILWFDGFSYEVEPFVRILGPYPLTYTHMTFPDIQKAAAWTGTFLDLEPLFEADADFDMNDYVGGVFDAGLFHERRLFVPLFYEFPVLLTTEEALRDFGLHLDEQPGFDTLMEEISKYIELSDQYPERLLFQHPNMGLQAIFPWLGESLIDYGNFTAHTDTAWFREAMYAYEMMYEMDALRPPLPLSYVWFDKYAPELIYDRQVLFSFTLGQYAFLMNYGPLHYYTDETPVWFPFPSASGAPVGNPVFYAGIRSGSPNQLNAYRFLRILMGEDFQSRITRMSDFPFDYIPINKAALETSLEWMIGPQNEFGMGNARWGAMFWRHFPELLGYDYIALAQSAAADQNFTHSVLEIVHQEMLPFFRGERAFEEANLRLRSRLTIYVGE